MANKNYRRSRSINNKAKEELFFLRIFLIICIYVKRLCFFLLGVRSPQCFESRKKSNSNVLTCFSPYSFFFSHFDEIRNIHKLQSVCVNDAIIFTNIAIRYHYHIQSNPDAT